MLGVESSTANRIAARLSEYKDGLRKQPGYGFITRRRAPHDQRLVELTLTPKGYGFLRKVSNRLNGGTSDS